ncbi:CCT motif family protein [Rhynchospora pubera]|uniref:CCT motif family protein n=1 Tax=Rhynchospora pubera TaxID=906938 RepID=A0AAV8EEM1_9POAL|nr:CCT motif family protein [Rhynchospora pubera]
MYRTSSTCSEELEAFNSSMYISIQQPPMNSSSSFSSFLNPSPPSYSSSFLNPNNSYSNNSYLHRSNSSQSLPIYQNHHIQDFVNNPTTTTIFSSSSPPSSSCRDFLDFNSLPVRRVFSTGDLQGINGSQVMAENSSQEGSGSLPSKVTRYSAEERKERIEKYRSKRNQRNFQKKITYACRKTLADSRPRVKGRFARNGEPETEAETESEIAESNNYGCFNHGSYNNYDCHGINGGGSQGDVWRQFEQAMEADDEGIVYFYDEEMWNLSDVLPMNMLS